MSALLMLPNGIVEVKQGDRHGRLPAGPDVLKDQDAIGPYAHIRMTSDEGGSYSIHMGIDPTQPVNTFARLTIDGLSGIHMVCFGPVYFTGLDDDTIKELIRG